MPRKDKKGRQDRHHNHRSSVQCIASALSMAAPSIEAAGSLDRAIQLGPVGMSESVCHSLRAMLPKSRGGALDGPKVEHDWQHLVEKSAKANDVTVAEIRLQMHRIAKYVDNQEAA